MKLVAYVRVSVANQSDSLYAQREAIEAWVKSEGHEIVATYADDGISGVRNADDREGLALSIASIVYNGAEGLVVHRLDRLARELHLQEAVLAQVWDANGSVFEVVGGLVLEDDPSDPMRTFARQVCGAARQLERGMIVARMQGGRRRARAAGRHIGGRRPFGFTIGKGGQLEPLEAEQVVIRRTRDLREGGAGIREIGREVNLHPEAVRRILARERPAELAN